MIVDRPEGRATDPSLDPDPLPGLPRPRCPVCYGLACPTCHRADEVKIIWGIPKSSWHALCGRCQKGFPADD